MIRKAEPSDIEAICYLIRRFHASSQYLLWLPHDGLSVRGLVERMLGDENAAVFVLDDLKGAMGLQAYQHPMSGDLTVSEMFFYVEPEARGQGVGLMRRAEGWSREVGARRLLMISPEKDERVQKFYERSGFEAVEVHFVKGLS